MKATVFHKVGDIRYKTMEGAHKVILSDNKEAMTQNELTLDLILIPDKFDMNPYVSLIKCNGSLVTVGLLGPYKSPTATWK